jgi:cation:H+ antiporter
LVAGIFMPYILLAVGVMLLLAGGTMLVRGASGIARSFNVSTVIIGLTVVAFGTSTPELVVNITGALSNETELAFGNAVGSNLANFGLVLGIAALITPIYLQSQIVRREVPYLLLITAILMVMAADQPLSGLPSILDRGDSIILFLLFTIFVYIMVRDIINGQGDPIFREADEYQASRASGGHLFNSMLVVVGIAMLATGGQMTIVQGAVIAELHNVPEVVIGIFVVAVGTSLPELVTSVIAAYKDESDLALGNIVGSNIFNSLVVLPAAGIIRPIPVPEGGALDLAVGFLFVLVVIPLFFFSQARLGRLAGAGLLTTYVIYMLYRFSS